MNLKQLWCDFWYVRKHRKEPVNGITRYTDGSAEFRMTAETWQYMRASDRLPNWLRRIATMAFVVCLAAFAQEPDVRINCGFYRYQQVSTITNNPGMLVDTWVLNGDALTETVAVSETLGIPQCQWPALIRSTVTKYIFSHDDDLDMFFVQPRAVQVLSYNHTLVTNTIALTSARGYFGTVGRFIGSTENHNTPDCVRYLSGFAEWKIDGSKCTNKFYVEFGFLAQPQNAQVFLYSCITQGQTVYFAPTLYYAGLVLRTNPTHMQLVSIRKLMWYDMPDSPTFFTPVPHQVVEPLLNYETVQQAYSPEANYEPIQLVRRQTIRRGNTLSALPNLNGNGYLNGTRNRRPKNVHQ